MQNIGMAWLGDIAGLREVAYAALAVAVQRSSTQVQLC